MRRRRRGWAAHRTRGISMWSVRCRGHRVRQPSASRGPLRVRNGGLGLGAWTIRRSALDGESSGIFTTYRWASANPHMDLFFSPCGAFISLARSLAESEGRTHAVAARRVVHAWKGRTPRRGRRRRLLRGAGGLYQASNSQARVMNIFFFFLFGAC